jgi:concanavalin A-like lectin/glucanase superfamily protein/PEP-CTERM motif-containing protein
VFLRRTLTLAAIAGFALAASHQASAATIAYWRMEADLNPSANGLQVANEIAGGSALLSASAFVDLIANPNGTVPATGSTNLGSLGSTQQGGAAGINASAAWYAALDTASLTLEFWARTGEAQATLISRTSGANGIVIQNPNALSVTYYVSNGAGGGTAVTLSGLDNMDANWSHYAFSYDAASGVGLFYVDGVVVASNDGADNRGLFWGAPSSLQVGTLMDYATAFNGTLDEVRLDNTALAPTGFLNQLVPEPGTALLLGFGLAGLAARRRSPNA